MFEYAAPVHSYLTILLLVLYLYLTIRFFRSKNNVSTLDRFLVQVARYVLLLVYIAGLVLYISLSKFVSQAHHLLSNIPAVLVVGVKYLPYITRKPNSLKIYAWVFTLLLISIIILAISAKISMMPEF